VSKASYNLDLAILQEVMDNHLKSYLISKGAMVEERHPVDIYGHKYSDPIALFGMALEDYAHFLVSP